MSKVVQDEMELTRRGFITNYPAFRYWRREAIDEGLETKPLNIYVHMPYCIQRCDYCYFKTTTLKENRLKQIDRYVDSVCREIELGSKRFHLRERPATSIYFGGGTPTLMSGENIGRIMDTLYGNLDIQDPEITFEGEPVTLTDSKARILRQHRVNRISVGIQSFTDEIVFGTGRKDTEEQALRAIAAAKDTGAVVNIDLISGLAGETPQTWAHSVARAMETQVQSITLYKLELYANTQYFSDSRKETIALPSDAEELDFVNYAMEEFEKNGYLPVNSFTFTKDGGYAQRHTTSKWQGDDIYAFGVSAFGAMGAWAYQNTNDLVGYSETVERDELPVFRAYSYSSVDMMVRDVVLGIKLIHLNHRKLRKKHGVDLLPICGPELATLEEDGFVTVDDENISLTRKGILYGDYVGRVLEASINRWRAAA